MSAQELREAMAELLGWKRPDHPDAMKLKVGWVTPEKWWLDPWGVLRFGHDIPDYPDSLDAMREAEIELDARHDLEFMEILPRVVMRDEGLSFDKHDPGAVARSIALHATALQRCEALLRAHGAWKGGEL